MMEKQPNRKEKVMAKDKSKKAEVVEKVKATEYVGIAIRLYPDVIGKGDRVARDIRNKDTAEKFEVTMPFPANDAECKALYNVDLETLARHGLRQLSYDTDTDAMNLIKEQVAAGVSMTNLAEAVRAELESAFFTEKARKATGGAKAKAAEARRAEASTGMSVAEMEAFILEQKAKGLL
jgi:hypothetical protein